MAAGMRRPSLVIAGLLALEKDTEVSCGSGENHLLQYFRLVAQKAVNALWVFSYLLQGLYQNRLKERKRFLS